MDVQILLFTNGATVSIRCASECCNDPVGAKTVRLNWKTKTINSYSMDVEGQKGDGVPTHTLNKI